MSRVLTCVAAALLVASVAAVPGRAETSTMTPSFFASVEVRSENLAPFVKWRGALTRAAEEQALAEARACPSGGREACPYADWENLLRNLKHETKRAQIETINEYMNDHVYISDPRNWGVNDYWAAPGEFFVKFGDCEDYAIAKYLSLKRLGWSDDDVRIAAVMDLNLNVGHAVVIVYLDGRTWLLDNQIEAVIETDRVVHYRPVFSINQSAWWRHIPEIVAKR